MVLQQEDMPGRFVPTRNVPNPESVKRDFPDSSAVSFGVFTAPDEEQPEEVVCSFALLYSSRQVASDAFASFDDALAGQYDEAERLLIPRLGEEAVGYRLTSIGLSHPCAWLDAETHKSRYTVLVFLMGETVQMVTTSSEDPSDIDLQESIKLAERQADNVTAVLGGS